MSENDYIIYGDIKTTPYDLERENNIVYGDTKTIPYNINKIMDYHFNQEQKKIDKLFKELLGKNERYKMSENEKFEFKLNTHIVLKNADVNGALTATERHYFLAALHKIRAYRYESGRNPSPSYFICNIDEPYADKVLDVIKNGEQLFNEIKK